MKTETINATAATAAFEDFNSEDHAAWRLHRDVLSKVSQDEVGYRGCMALGMVPDNTSCNAWIELGDRHLLIPDRDVHWVTMIDLPRSRWYTAQDREVHLMSVLKTTVRYGMPSLSPGGVEKIYDFRRMPFGTIQRGEETGVAGDDNHAETLNSDYEPHLFRVGNLLNWCMTSTAVHYRATWASARKAYYKALGVQPGDKPVLMFGENQWDHVERPFGWMPRPFLGFPQESVDTLFDRATKPGLVSQLRLFTDSFKLAFMADVDCGMPAVSHIDGQVRQVKRGQHYHGMPAAVIVVTGPGGVRQEIPVRTRANIVVAVGQAVKRGDVVAFDGPDLPDEWPGFSLYKKWEGELPKRLGRQHFETVLRMWFDRQLLYIEPGYVHAPASITSLAALGSADDTKLWWDVYASQRYYSSGADAFIFPSIKLGRWDDFRFPVAGDIDFDLTPASDHYIPRRDQTVKNSDNAKNAKNAKKVTGKEANTKKVAADQSKDNKKKGGKPATPAKPDTKKNGGDKKKPKK